ncbi:MAG: type II secretion system F family protein [Roseovarius sp.]
MENLYLIETHYLLYIGAAVGFLITFEGIRQSLMGDTSSEAQRARRIEALNDRMALRKTALLKIDAQKSAWWNKIPVYGTLPGKMLQAGMTMKPRAFIGAMVGITLILLFVYSALLGIKTGVLIAALSGPVIPMSVINIIRKKRVEAFSQQLPEALDLMMRGLRVGHPLNVTIANVSENMADPIATEFRIMSDQITYGDDLVDALNDMADRIDQEDMHYLAVSISIQHGTGGNLASMLGTLARVIRGRFAMRRRIKALSAEGRITAIVLSSLPFLMYGATLMTAPDYYSSVQDDPLFIPIAAAIIIFVTANAITMRNLVNFRI